MPMVAKVVKVVVKDDLRHTEVLVVLRLLQTHLSRGVPILLMPGRPLGSRLAKLAQGAQVPFLSAGIAMPSLVGAICSKICRC